MEHAWLFIILATFLGFLMTWGVGANDLSNVLSTSMGSKAISVRQALMIAVIFEFAGAFLASGSVTETIRHGLINVAVLADRPEILIYGMLAVLLAGTTWITFASYMGLPVSITHTIIGSIVGFGALVLGFNAVHWNQVGVIAMTWVTSPLLSGVIAYLIFMSVQWMILARRDPFERAKRRAPFYFFLIGFVMCALTLVKGLRHFGIHFSSWGILFISIIIGFLVILLGNIMIRDIELRSKASRHEAFKATEKVFAVLTLFTACAMVFAHGSNDVANAVGPMTVIVCLVERGGELLKQGTGPTWILVWGIFGIILGFLMYGRKIIETVGSGITALTPSRAFAATLSAAMTTVLATSTGIPVSTTQILVGGVLGVGMARGIGALNMNIIRNIFMSWIITIPVGALLSMTFFYVFEYIFSFLK